MKNHLYQKMMLFILSFAMLMGVSMGIMPQTAKAAENNNLTDVCPAYQSSGYYTEYSRLKSGGTTSFNLGGVSYKNGFTFRQYYDPTWAVYNLDGRFERLTGIICHVDGTGAYNTPMQVFFDGMLQDDLSFELTADMSPTQIDWNLEGVKQLKILMTNYTYSNVAIYGIGNPELTYVSGKETDPEPSPLGDREFNLVDILPAYQSQQYTEHSLIKTGGTTSFNLGGVTYKDGFVFRQYYDPGWAVYNLDGKFDKLTGVLCHVDGTGNYDTPMQVFFDGILQDKLSIGLTSDMPPKQIEWDVTGVKQLKINLTEYKYSNVASYGIGNPVLRFASGVTLPTFKVTFNSNGGSSVSSVDVTIGEKVTMPKDPTRTGYKFIGWYGDSSLQNAWYNNIAIMTEKTLYAKWEKLPTYTVVFESNDGSSVSPIIGVDTNSKIKKPTNPKRTGYTFKGWYKDAKLKNAWAFGKDTVASDMILYAKWEAKTVTITFKANGGKIGTKSSTKITNTYDKKIKLASKPTRKNYKFDGWYTAKTGGTLVSKTSSVPAKNTIYYAHWTRK